MKTNIKQIGTILLAVVILGNVLALSSCKKKEAPALPPKSTFVFENMKDNTKDQSKDLINTNAPLALGHVGVWSTITGITVIVPVLAYEAALTQEAEHVSGNKWVRELSFEVGVLKYSAKLYSEQKKDIVNWEMHISGPLYNDFVWFTGSNDVNNTKGQWIINKSHIENHNFIQIDWTLNQDDNTGTIKYTNIEPGSNLNGSYLYHGNDQAGNYNVFYNVFNKLDNNLIEIDYNTTSYEGRIKDFKFYEDNLWHCWNHYFQDEVCEGTAK